MTTSTCDACGATYRGSVKTCPNCSAGILPETTELRPGRIVDGKYEILSLLGVGGMGEVFKVRHIHLNTLRTIKVMRRTLLTDETYRNRFAREARLATLLQHPNVALVYDFSTLPDDSYYMVSEFIEGITIRQWSSLHGRLSPALAVTVAVQTLNGLEHIHRAGLLHRDLSADNIMISAGPDGAPLAKIIDLGIAKRVTATAVGEETQAGIFVGNPRYSSPEQLGALEDGGEIDARADIYCFGIVLYEMLAGVAPFVSNSPGGYVAKHLAALPPPLLSQPGTENVPAALQDIVAKALEKDRSRRYATAREFATALMPFLTQSMSETTQMKILALNTGPQANQTGGDRHVFPSTMVAPPPDATEEEAWKEAVSSNTRESLQDYLIHYPAGPNALVASTRISELNLLAAVEKMAEQGDASSLTRLAAAHPSDSNIGTAVRAALDRIPESLLPSDEKRAWLAAAEAGTDAMWTDYLSRFPDSPRAFEARLRRDELRDFASASRAGTAPAWRSFLQAWPESLHRTAAIGSLRETEERASRVGEAPAANNSRRPLAEDDVPDIPDAPGRMNTFAVQEKWVQAPAKPNPAVPKPEIALLTRVAAEAALLLLLTAFVLFNVRAARAEAAVPLPPLPAAASPGDR